MPFHVFLSHSSTDKPAVEELARRLAKEGIQAWLDKWHLIPGDPWQPALEKALAESQSCAVFVGPSGFGPWQNEEMRAAIDQRVRDSGRRFRVIPVLLPGAHRAERSSLPTFLAATTWVEFRDSLDDEDAFHRLMCGIRGFEPGAGPGQAIYEGQCPYRGLRVFDADDAPFFFGREALVQWLLNELRPAVEGQQVNRFLAIVGSSGSGKSSVARAGLVAAIRRDDISTSSRWPVAICRPGSDPLESLAVALSSAVDVGQGAPALAELIAEFQKNEKTLHLIARQSLPENAPAKRLVVVVDQFEEVFTLCRKDELREALIRNLLYAAKVAQGQTLVILTMRADFYGKCAANAELAAAFSDHHVLVGPMMEEELRRAIERPTQLVGCELEAGLVDLLVQDVRRQPGALPLLQHALLELWNKREGRRLTVKAYQEIGKLEGALQRRADATLNAFSQDEQELCRRMFLRLTQPGEGTEDTKRRASMQELLSLSGKSTDEEDIIQKLADASLLTTEGDLTQKDAFVEVAHEALIRNWPRLRQWLDEDRTGLLLHHRISEVAQEWQRSNKEEGMLYRGARLTQAQEWRERNEAELNPSEREFLDASIAERQKLERQQGQRQRLLLGAAILFAVLFIAASGAAIFGFLQKIEAEKQKQRANEAANAAGKSASLAEERLARAQIEEGRAWIERAKLNSTHGNNFAASLMAARALGFAGFGREKIADPKFNEEYPVLLSTSGDSIDEQEARLQITEAVSARYSGWPLWQSPVFRQHSDAVKTLAWSPDGKILASGSGDQTIKLWEAASGKLLTTLQGHTNTVLSLAWSPDGKILASGSRDKTVKLWEAVSGKLLTTLQRHTGEVYSVAWSPDGKVLASGSRDQTIKLWEAASAKLLTTLQGHTDTVLSVAWSPDGKILASGSWDKTVKLWEAVSAKLLTTLQGHTNPVLSVAWSPDGKILASGSRDPTVRLWEAASGKLLTTLHGHTGEVYSVAWNPDGKVLASGSWDKTVKLWEAASGKLLTTLHGHTGEVYSVAWSPDGKVLASGSWDKTVKLWEAASGKLLSTLQGHTDVVYSVAWSPDGKVLASGSGDQTIKLWEAASGKLLTTLQGHTDKVESVAWSPDGKILASGSDDKTVKLWEAASAKLLTTLQGHTDRVYSVAWSPDGKILASGSGDQTIKLWEAASGKLLTTVEGHTGEVACVAWSPDGKILASGSWDKTVKLWEAVSAKLLTTLQGHTNPVLSVAWSPDGKILASGSRDKTIKLWEAGKLLTTLQGHTGEVYSVAWSPDGKILASGSWDKTVKLWEAASAELLTTLQGHTDKVESVAWSPDGKILASGSDDKTVKLWEAASAKLLTTLQGHTDKVESVAWSPDGKILASGSDDKTVKLWEAASAKLLTTLQGHTHKVESVAWSPDGKILASGSGDQTIKLWEAASGKLLTTVEGHTGEVACVAWSPDGKILASGSDDKTVKLWEAASGKLLTTLQGHTHKVESVAWSPDGKILASGSDDETVKLWEAASGKLLTTLQGHTHKVESVAWSPDGKILASGSDDETVKLWEAASGKLLTTLQGHTDTVLSVAWSPDGKVLASGSWDRSVRLWEAVSGKLLTTLQGHTDTVYSVAWSPDGKILASGSWDKTVKFWEAPSLSDIDLAEYLRSRWVRLAGSEVVWEPNDNLLRDRSFDVVNLRETTLLGIERSGLSGSQKVREQLSLLLRAGNFSEAIAIWKAAPAESADSATLRLLLAAVSASAANDLFSNAHWRGLWLTEQMQPIITSETMLDPAVSLAVLRLDTQLAFAGSDDTEVVSVRESFNAHLAGHAPRSWFATLGRNLLAVTTDTDATMKERQAALDQLRRLTQQIPDSPELRHLLEEALSELH